jgi:hypothetical protein
MKKLLITFSALATCFVPMIGQSSTNAFNGDNEIVVTAELAKDELPSSIIQAVNVKFDKDDPLTWSKFPHSLKEYGWVYEVGESNQDLSHYVVRMRTSTGDLMWGFYDADGSLSETREISKNIAIPRYILESLYAGPYKDWRIVGNREMINFYHTKDNSIAEQNFKLIIEKDKERKKMAFNYEVSSGKLEARVIR